MLRRRGHHENQMVRRGSALRPVFVKRDGGGRKGLER